MINASHPFHIEPAAAMGSQSGHDQGARDIGGDAVRQHLLNARAARRASGVDDLTCIFGIPATELTSSVQKALKSVLARCDDAKRQLDVGREREAYLQRLCDSDVVLPSANRRYLIRELARTIDRSRFNRTMNAFVLMSVANAADVRSVHGEAAVNRLLCAVAAVFAPNLRASDVVASLNAYEFGIILALAGGSAATRKAENLASAVASVSVEANGATVEGEAAWGLHELRQGDTPESVIAGADADLLRHLQRTSA